MMINTLAKEYSSSSTSSNELECYKVTRQHEILKSIANEVFKREKEGDRTAFDILNSVFNPKGVQV